MLQFHGSSRSQIIASLVGKSKIIFNFFNGIVMNPVDSIKLEIVT